MASQTQLAPFRTNTRQRMQKVFPTLAISFGATGQIPFPQVGLLARVFLFCNATIVDSAATPNTPASTFGPFNILKRITGQLNLGISNVFDISGYGANMISHVQDTAVGMSVANLDITGAGNIDAFYTYPSSLVQNAAKAVSFVALVPVSANDGPQFQVGLVNLQAPEVRFTLNITFGQQADLYPGSTTAATQTLGGTLTAYYEYYEVPDPDTVQLPARVLHRLLEDRTSITATGDTTYLTPRQGVLLQMMHNVIINGAIDKTGPAVVTGNAVSNVTGRRLVFNKTDTPYSYDPIVDRILSRFRYGYTNGGDLPSGMYLWDFFNAMETPSQGDLRDAVDTEALSTLESIVTISPSATLGSSNNFLDTIRRVFQQY